MQTAAPGCPPALVSRPPRLCISLPPPPPAAHPHPPLAATRPPATRSPTHAHPPLALAPRTPLMKSCFKKKHFLSCALSRFFQTCRLRLPLLSSLHLRHAPRCVRPARPPLSGGARRLCAARPRAPLLPPPRSLDLSRKLDPSCPLPSPLPPACRALPHRGRAAPPPVPDCHCLPACACPPSPTCAPTPPPRPHWPGPPSRSRSPLAAFVRCSFLARCTRFVRSRPPAPLTSSLGAPPHTHTLALARSSD